MSEAGISSEIEDVLASIRRLVSQDTDAPVAERPAMPHRAAPRPAAVENGSPLPDLAEDEEAPFAEVDTPEFAAPASADVAQLHPSDTAEAGSGPCLVLTAAQRVAALEESIATEPAIAPAIETAVEPAIESAIEAVVEPAAEAFAEPATAPKPQTVSEISEEIARLEDTIARLAAVVAQAERVGAPVPDEIVSSLRAVTRGDAADPITPEPIVPEPVAVAPDVAADAAADAGGDFPADTGDVSSEPALSESVSSDPEPVEASPEEQASPAEAVDAAPEEACESIAEEPGILSEPEAMAEVSELSVPETEALTDDVEAAEFADETEVSEVDLATSQEDAADCADIDEEGRAEEEVPSGEAISSSEAPLAVLSETVPHEVTDPEPLADVASEAEAEVVASDAPRRPEILRGDADLSVESLSILSAAEGVSPVGEDQPLIDEAALRAMIAQVIRTELRGDLGERITHNVRKLVRREVLRVLAETQGES